MYDRSENASASATLFLLLFLLFSYFIKFLAYVFDNIFLNYSFSCFKQFCFFFSFVDFTITFLFLFRKKPLTVRSVFILCYFNYLLEKRKLSSGPALLLLLLALITCTVVVSSAWRSLHAKLLTLVTLSQACYQLKYRTINPQGH